jgi:ribose transport system substrate-binding protein
MRKLQIFLVLLAACIFVQCGGESENKQDKSGTETTKKPFRIVVIPKGTANPFWKTVHAGAAKAQKELGVEILWVGPENETDRQMQINVVQNHISMGVDAIVLAPLDAKALVNMVELAVSRKIPVIIIDSALETDVQSSFVATDNKEGGRLGARRLGELMGGKGKAILLRYSVGAASTENREAGFLEEMAASFPDIELVSTDQYAGVTRESAQKASLNLLSKYGDEIQGVFCPNESSAFGMLRALENRNRSGKIKFVGFDTSKGLLEGLRAGTIQGLVSQDPLDMGYQGVKAAVAVLKGETISKRIPTRLEMITPENMDEPDMKELIDPDLEKYLGAQ